MAGRGDCRFLIAVMGVVGFLVAEGTGVKGADFSPDCTKHILSLSPCLDFVTGFDNAGVQPTEDCCPVLANVLAHEPACLCMLFPIDLTLVVSLPAACNINTSPETCKDISFTHVSAYVPPKRESNPPGVNAGSLKYSDTDSIETLTPIPGPDSFATPIFDSPPSDTFNTPDDSPPSDSFETPDADSFETPDSPPLDSFETPDADSFATPIPDVDPFETPITDTDSFETLTPIPGPDFFETPIPDIDSLETLTPIPGPDFFETPIPDTDSFEILVPTSPFGSANAKDNEGNGAGGLWEPLIRFWDLGMNYFS